MFCEDENIPFKLLGTTSKICYIYMTQNLFNSIYN